MESRSIRLEPAAWRALKDHFAAKMQAWHLVDEFGEHHESKTVRDLLARWVNKWSQAKAVMDRLVGPRLGRGIRAWYHDKIFKPRYRAERLDRFSRLPFKEQVQKWLKTAPADMREIGEHLSVMAEQCEKFTKELDSWSCEGAA